MRHRRRTRKLGMKTAHREAMFRNMVTSLFEHGRITTTVPRAKELRRIADKLVTLAKRGDLHARRQALSVIREKRVVGKLFDEIVHRFKTRSGGYTRVIKIGPRRGDAAMMALVELAYENLRPEGRPSVQREKEQPSEDVIPMATSSSEEEAKGPASVEVPTDDTTSQATDKVQEPQSTTNEMPGAELESSGSTETVTGQDAAVSDEDDKGESKGPKGMEAQNNKDEALTDEGKSG